MKTSDIGKRFIAEVEGNKLKPYKDTAGLDTIGVGHLITETEQRTGMINISGLPVPWKTGISAEQSLALLAQDLVATEKDVNGAVIAAVSQNQFDALVSFTFNLGLPTLLKSSVLKEVNAGNFSAVPARIRLYNKVRKGGGLVVDKGIVNRREKECLLWDGKYTPSA